MYNRTVTSHTGKFNKMNKKYLIFIFLTLSESISKTYAFRVFDVNGVETYFALENEYIQIKCKTDLPMAYCGFIHPNGGRYSFSGSSLKAGHCSVKINATKKDSGEWRCHMGTGDAGVEDMKIINVRVVKQVAALQENISIRHGKEITLACATTKGLVPLSYCRFEPPNGKPFSINSKVTSTNPILDRYYFPRNKSLDRGDCAVTIRKVKYEDLGKWTCGAGLDDGKEHIGIISLEVEGLSISTVSVIGITFVVILGLLGLLGFIAWRKRQFLGCRDQDRVEAEAHELGHLPSNPEGTPQSCRGIPRVIVQSPSESGTPRIE